MIKLNRFDALQPAKCSPVLGYDETVPLGDQRNKAPESPASLATADGCQHN
ncbi:hypothetical protein LOY55_19170 [Pseudomonas sp. B21-040]|jgi:hypothetical protein|uniref:hypothetical protein n=1 Tax=Pseudomonas sp. B21-040 TaxID=2895486 RepID=UPI00215E95C5|nr:hypothetical protein [Pseudomonas sp. B21-040]UVL38374.1 hypothetical protein LOY55_19170 [Pseudomonas sp. B21-040]